MTTRRGFLIGGTAGIVGALGWRARLAAQTAPTSAGPADPKLIEDLVAANRILADQGVVDGYGHVSVRHDRDPSRYLMSRSIAPETVRPARFRVTLATRPHELAAEGDREHRRGWPCD